jgi:putative ABC transport system ATP-binding protein
VTAPLTQAPLAGTIAIRPDPAVVSVADVGRPAVIELRHVTRTYVLGDEVFHALDDVSLVVRAGEFLAITGPSGSGKSTLANVISGLDHPTSGSVVIEGGDVARLSDNRLSRYRNRHIGFVFQSFNLQTRNTALENVMLPMLFSKMKGRERRARAVECLNLVGLGDRLRHRPGQLSGGQRQRVAIARALALRPSIIIADEPTGNLDSARGEEIMDLLADLNTQGTTLLAITHDPDIARRAQRIVSVHDGKLTEEGRPDALR